MKMDTLQFSRAPEEYLLNAGTYRCLSCVPKLEVKADGKDQKVFGNPRFDTISVRVVDPRSVEFSYKKEGRPTFACTETVSADGNTKVEEFTETPASQRVTGHATFTRVSKGPTGAHVLSGSWQMRTIKNVAGAGPTTTYQTTNDGLKVSAGGMTLEAKFDGRDYRVQGEPDHTVSMNRIDEDTIEQTEKRDGKVFRITRMTVSKDGRSMRIEDIDTPTDKQRGGSMTYTAEKVP